jgi:hypothetical protein
VDWAGVGRVAFPAQPYLTKFGTSGLPLMHLALNRPVDTGAMHKNITAEERRERLDAFLAFADEDGYFGTAEFERAIEHLGKEKGGDATFLVAQRGELATMLTVFGHARGSTARSLRPLANVMSRDDVEALWWRSEWPTGWLERRRAEWAPITEIDLLMGLRFAQMAVEQRRTGYEPIPVLKEAFAPWPGNLLTDQTYPSPIVPSADEPAPTAEEIAAGVTGGRLSTYDSRMGGPQPNPAYPDALAFPEPFPEEYWQPAWAEYEQTQAGSAALSYVALAITLLAAGAVCALCCGCVPRWGQWGRPKYSYAQNQNRARQF